MSNTKKLTTELDHLEETIARGLAAYSRRNEIIAALVDSGERQADVCRRLNATRERIGVEPLTPDAIAATLTRVRRKKH